MKRAIAILFSLVLTITQGAPPLSEWAAEDSAACSSHDCHCNTVSCCPTPSTPQSQPAPALPKSGKSQRDFQLLLVASHFFLYVQSCADSDLSPVQSSSVQVTSIPLYTRTCSLLI